MIRAERRARIGSGVSGPGTALWVEAEELDEAGADTDEVRTLAAEYKALVIATLQRRDAWQVIDTVNQVTDPSDAGRPGRLRPLPDDEQKRQLLETPDVAERLTVLIEWTKDHLAEIEVNDKIADDVREGMEKSQREFLLRQQLNAIRKELGEDEPDGAQDYRTRVEEADLPENVRKAALREVGKLERGQRPEPRVRLDPHLAGHRPRAAVEHQDHRLRPTSSPPARCWTPTTTAWTTSRTGSWSTWPIRARRAQRGLEVVGGRGSGAVMALVGPPGVGKTSLGESVARALGRKFVRVALGGVRDEAEIRGHRRTYVGALPGRIVRAITEAGSMNPVVLLDEIDKVGSDYRGDPAAALLEVLDPAQNHTFRDHYLEVDLDLSDVLFLATANVRRDHPAGPAGPDGAGHPRRLHRGRQGRHRPGLPAAPAAGAGGADRRRGRAHRRRAARDRGRLHPRGRRTAAGAAAGQGAAQGRDQADRADAEEPRQLVIDRRQPARLPRPAAVHPGGARADLGARRGHRAGGHRAGRRRAVHRGHTPVRRASGRPDPDRAARRRDEGVGADRAVLRPRARRPSSASDPAVLDRHIHLHVPAGAVPKDGPSAGVTMVTALASMATGRPVRSDVGMTGEVTLNGRVLPIGGVKQKLLAAQRAGLTTVFLPKRNEPDLDDVPAEVLEAIEVVLTTDVAELVAAAIEPARRPPPGRLTPRPAQTCGRTADSAARILQSVGQCVRSSASGASPSEPVARRSDGLPPSARPASAGAERCRRRSGDLDQAGHGGDGQRADDHVSDNQIGISRRTGCPARPSGTRASRGTPA